MSTLIIVPLNTKILIHLNKVVEFDLRHKPLYHPSKIKNLFNKIRKKPAIIAFIAVIKTLARANDDLTI